MRQQWPVPMRDISRARGSPMGCSNVRTVHIQDELVLSRAPELKASLLADVVGPGALTLDLSRVTDIDTAGVQLLILARRLADERGVVLHLGAPSTPVRDALRFLRLETLTEEVRS